MNSIRSSAPLSPGRPWTTAIAAAAALVALLPAAAWAKGPSGTARAPRRIRVVKAPSGMKLQVNGRDFMVFGMNWSYVPIGQNYTYSLWKQPDSVIKTALDREMTLLKRMGVNVIRVYVGIQPKWVRYIYEKHGIYTALNHTVGRYGYTLDGVWNAATDYSSPRMRAALKADVLAMVDRFKGTPGILMWLLGNENNYGLTWSSFEIENLPKGEGKKKRARYLYSLFGEIIRAIKRRDPHHPVAMANGDIQYIDIIAQECKGLDIFGANVYRGRTGRDIYDVVKRKLGLPFMYTEFGADAYDAKRMREDDVTQARYLLSQWEDIYEHSAGKGKAGNAIGGLIFQWSDGWWKYKQEENLDVHDTNASWAASAYREDYVKGQNNMNEEWWGICAKGKPDQEGQYDLYPRTAYYALHQAFRLDPYAPTTSLAAIRAHFSRIRPSVLATMYRAQKARQGLLDLKVVRVTGMRLKFETYSTGGDRLTTPSSDRGFDHLQSFWVDFQLKPVDSLVANLSLNILGNTPRNPIDEIFYERRGLPVRVACAQRTTDPRRCYPEPGSTTETFPLTGIDRLKIYGADLKWSAPWFDLHAFFRKGHYHWAYEGDFFNIYREANYGPNINIYNADTPLGLEFTFKKALEGLKLAFGPELWWAANPALILKYSRKIGPVQVTVVNQEQIDKRAGGTAGASGVSVPERLTRRTSLHIAYKTGPVKLEWGGLWAGSPQVGKRFRSISSFVTFEDKTEHADTLGTKAKITVESGRWHWYAQGAYMGLIAEGGGRDQAMTFADFSLRDSGSGNQVNALTGLAVHVGDFLIAPNFLYQRPLVGPGPSVSLTNPLRNILDDPFAVLGNREMVGAELMLVYDPTPATFFFRWDHEKREDARFAASLNFVWRRYLASRDAYIGVLADGTLFPFPGAPPARDLWEVKLHFVSSLPPYLRMVGNLYVGRDEPRGDSQRAVNRYGGEFRLAYRNLAFSAFMKFNDWGPYDYHRDFNLTFPLQMMADLGYTFGLPRWLGRAQTRFGIRAKYRYLNAFSPRFVADPTDPTRWANEWEVRTYLVFTL